MYFVVLYHSDLLNKEYPRYHSYSDIGLAVID